MAKKWNARYANSDSPLPSPADVLMRGESWLPAKGDALDLACGRGGNALWLAARGFSTHAWDISSAAIERLQSHAGDLKLQAETRDVLRHPPAFAAFDVIVVSRFLDRELCPAIANALRPAGVLFYQTFTHGLSNPDYLLGTNELLSLFPTLTVCWYYEPVDVVDGKAEAMLVARAP